MIVWPIQVYLRRSQIPSIMRPDDTTCLNRTSMTDHCTDRWTLCVWLLLLSRKPWCSIAETIWPTFCRRHFHTHCLELNCLCFDWIFCWNLFPMTSWGQFSIRSGNDLVVNTQQAINPSNDDPVFRRHMTFVGHNEFIRLHSKSYMHQRTGKWKYTAHKSIKLAGR